MNLSDGHSIRDIPLTGVHRKGVSELGGRLLWDRILFALGDQRDQAGLLESINMVLMNSCRRLHHDLVEHLYGVFVSLESSEQHAPVVVVRQDVDGFGAWVYVQGGLVDQLDCMLVALGFQA